MSSKQMYRLAGILFLVAAFAFFVTGQTALGAAFVAIGGSFVAISSTTDENGESLEGDNRS